MAAPVKQAAGGGTRLDLGEERQTRYWRTLVRLVRYALPYRGRVAWQSSRCSRTAAPS